MLGARHPSVDAVSRVAVTKAVSRGEVGAVINQAG